MKSRDFAFICPDDYPYKSVMVDTVNGWDGKDAKPIASLVVSTVTGAILAVRSVTEPRWTTITAKDTKRGVVETS